MDTFSVSRKVIFDFLIKNNCTNDLTILLEFLKINYNLAEEHLEKVSTELSRYFLPQFYKKWKVPFNVQSKFEAKYEKWLNSDFTVNFSYSEAASTLGRKSNENEYEQLSTSSKRRKLIEIEETFSPSEIQDAFIRNLRTTGKLKLANAICKLLCSHDNNDAENTFKLKSPLKPYSSEEALALIEDLRLTKYQYKVLRQQAKERNADMYPSYHNIMQAKNECYPSQITITETEARFDMQSLIDHTVLRMFKDSNVNLPGTTGNETCDLKLVIKYGCDGTSNQSRYHQKFNIIDSSDESLFTISMVPICLVTSDNLTMIWKNPHPSSPKRCIPIALLFDKETNELTNKEMNCVKEQIERLQPTKINSVMGNYLIKSEMNLTMVDGKVCQALTNTPSAATCYICGATPKEMNDLEKVKKKVNNISTYQFGLSTLHAVMNFAKCILQIAYRLEFCKWCARTHEHKGMLEKAKARIQREFKETLGLIVDQPTQGSGTSNNGNLARRFFEDPEKTAKITGVNKDLIGRFSIVLKMLTCSNQVPKRLFIEFAHQTAKLYVSLYPWYYMPSTVHKILLHGGQVMEHFHLPIGQYSEEAAEARNKQIRHYREFHTRKMSRLATMEDLVHKLLVSSDLYIATLRVNWEKIKMENDFEIMNILTKYEKQDTYST